MEYELSPYDASQQATTSSPAAYDQAGKQQLHLGYDTIFKTDGPLSLSEYQSVAVNKLYLIDPG